MQPTKTNTSSTFIMAMNAIAQKVLAVPFFAWFVKKGYLQGVFWAIMISLTSICNDVLMRFLGDRLHFIEISFFRFFFCMVTVLPFMLPKGAELFKTRHPSMHVYRAIFGMVALACCCYSVNVMSLAENTTIMFAEPLFFLPLAVLFLNENVDKPRWIATLIGFFGLIVILQPGTDTFKPVAFVPMLAAILFAASNVLVKKMFSNQKENAFTMLFYFGLGASLITLIPLLFVWQTPTLSELGLLALLGIGGNMIQVCLFLAFSATDASSLMPFRYTEFVFASLFGFLFFGQIPTATVLVGALLIVMSTFYISHVEMKRSRNLKK